MAPFDFAGDAWVATLLGAAFGVVLERSGFGDSRILTAQFYLHDMRVLRVMFTAIATAALLLGFGHALGLVDMAAIWVPPTHLWPGLVGGFLLGVGFLVGGYCPGTSLVAAATLKLDGLAFVGGLLLGIVGFNLAAPGLLHFWQQSGNLGRVTLMDVTGLSTGAVVLGVVLLALATFWIGGRVERAARRRLQGRIPAGKGLNP
ncbi:MAG: YeeE/YedE family protein [Myxococcales bacterium]|nr:YeeE/YedE family protein [Myxococcales bacterium]